MAGIHFDFTADNSNFVEKVRQINDNLKSTNEVLKDVKAGSVSFQDKIVALNAAIKGNETVINAHINDIKAWNAELKSAFESGDTGKINSLNEAILKSALEMQNLTEETNKFKEALYTVESMAGTQASSLQTVSSPQFFSSKDDYDKANALRSQAGDISSQLADFSKPEEELQQLRETLSQVEEELRGLEATASDAASKLGADLGSRAAEASQQLYDLSNAILSQEQTVNTLSEAVKSASTELQLLKETSDDAKEIEVAQVKFDALSTSLNNAENQLRNLQAAQVDAQTQWAQVDAEVQQHDSLMVKMLGGYDKYTAIIAQLPAPLQGVIGSIQGMTGASKAFIATPLGAVIGAIVLVLQSLKTWFDSSVEGQMAFAEISGYVSGVLGQLKEIVIGVGKAIYSAFSNPKQAVSDLWEAIKTNIVNRFKALGQLGAHVGEMLEAAFTPGKSAGEVWGKIQDDVLQLTTGIEGATEKIQDYTKGVHDAAKATAEIAKENKQIDIDEHEWGKRRAEINKIKAEAQATMYDTSKSATERKKALADFESALQEQYDKEREFADRRVAVQEEAMKITTNRIEDENKLRDLQAQRLELDARQAQEIASLQRRKNGINNAGLSELRQGEKQAEALKKVNEDLLKLQAENIENELSLMSDGIDKKLHLIELEYQKRRAEIQKQEQLTEEQNKKAGLLGLTSEQSEEFSQALDLAERARDKALESVRREEAQQMLDYLKQYGTFQQKKLAIAEEYNRKIADTTDDWVRKSLEKQRDEAIQSIDNNALKLEIDWASVFGNFGGMLQSEVDATLARLRDYMQSDEFKRLNAIDQKTVTDAVLNLQTKASTDLKDVDFKKLGELTSEVQSAQEAYVHAKRQETITSENLKRAQEQYNEALSSGTEAERLQAEVTLGVAQRAFESASNAVIEAEQSLNSLSNNLQTASESATLAIQGVSDGLSKLSSGSLAGAFEGLKTLAQNKQIQGAIGSGFSTLLNSTQGTLIGAILGLLDVLKGGIGTLISSLLDAIFDAVSGILSNILSGDFVGQIATSLVDGIGNIFSSISGGLLGFSVGSILGQGNSERVAKLTEQLTASNERLRYSVDSLKDEISGKSGWEAVETAERAMDAEERRIENQRAILDANMHEWKRGTHSNVYHWGFTDSDYGRLNNILAEYAQRNGKTASSAHSYEDVLALSPEEMDYIRSNYADMWEYILERGYLDKSEYWDAFADLAGNMEEIQEALNEALTQISFDSFRDRFVDSLMDMDKDASDFADDFSNYLMKAVLNAKISDLLDSDLKDFYEEWSELSKDGLTQDEITHLKSMYDAITERGLQLRDEVATITGYDKSASGEQSQATRGYGVEFSEDNIGEVMGRATAIQDSNERLAQSVLEGLGQMQSIATIMSDNNATLTDMLAQHAIANSHLTMIEKYTKKMSEFGNKLDAIVDNTKNL